MKSKKLIAVITAILLAVSLFPSAAFAATDNNTGFLYTVKGNEVTITGYLGQEENLTIPDTLEGKPVTAIADCAFGPSYTLKSITIGANVAKIGKNPFKDCSIKNIYISSKNKNFVSDENLFLYDKNHTKIYSSVKYTKKSSYSIPDTVMDIGDFAFENCYHIAEIILPDGLKRIGEGAFEGCGNSEQDPDAPAPEYGIQNINIPKNVEEVGKDAFYRTYDLAVFNVDAANTHYSSVNGVLFDKAKKSLIQYPSAKKDTSYTVPASVTAISEHCFFQNSYLKNIILPNGLLKIGNTAFENMEIENITIPKTVTFIGAGAFNSWYMFITVDAKNTKYSSEKGVLFDKAKKTIIYYPECKTDKSYTVPSSVTKIADNCFSYTTKLATLDLPAGLKSIGHEAFVNDMSATRLKNISISSKNKYFTVRDGVLFDKSKKTLLLYPAGKTVKSYKIPNTVKTIAAGAFYGAELQKVIIPESVKYINEDAFLCGLKAIKIPDSVIKLGKRAFWGSTSLNIGKGLKSISEGVFDGCKVKNITIPKNIESIETGAFGSCDCETATVPYQTLSIGKDAFQPGDTLSPITMKCYKYSAAYYFAQWNGMKIKLIGTTPKYNVSAASSSAAYGTVSGSGSFYYGNACTLTATPKTGYKFVKWTEGKKTVSTKAAFNIVVKNAHSLKAVFAKK